MGVNAVIEQSRDSVSASQTSAINAANGTSCKPTQTVIIQCVKESWSPNWESPLAHTLQSAWCQLQETQQNVDGLELVKALREVVVMPKLEYQLFDGDPLEYVTFFTTLRHIWRKITLMTPEDYNFSSSTAQVKLRMRLKAALTCLLARVIE